MKIYAYTDEKIIVKVDRSIEQICADGIDPWRIDLLDSKPLQIEVDGTILNFRRFGDVAFAYQRTFSDNRVFMCKHDGTAGVCFIGDCPDFLSEPSETRLRNIQPSAEPFQTHLAEYLRLAETTPALVSTAHACQNLKMQGDGVVLDLMSKGLAQDSIPFAGEMKEETFVSMVLDERINWVFDKLEQFHPLIGAMPIVSSIVTGSAFRVDVYFDSKGESTVVDGLGASYSNLRGGYMLCREGCWYCFEPRLFSFKLTRMMESHLLSNQNETVGYSVDDVYCTRRNEVRGTRIAVHDLSLKQFRTISLRKPLVDHQGNLLSPVGGRVRGERYESFGMTQMVNDNDTRTDI